MVLTLVGCVCDGDGGTEERALDAGNGARGWARNFVEDDCGVAFEVWIDLLVYVRSLDNWGTHTDIERVAARHVVAKLPALSGIVAGQRTADIGLVGGVAGTGLKVLVASREEVSRGCDSCIGNSCDIWTGEEALRSVWRDRWVVTGSVWGTGNTLFVALAEIWIGSSCGSSDGGCSCSSWVINNCLRDNVADRCRQIISDRDRVIGIEIDVLGLGNRSCHSKPQEHNWKSGGELHDAG